jgi:hypothetical protein
MAGADVAITLAVTAGTLALAVADPLAMLLLWQSACCCCSTGIAEAESARPKPRMSDFVLTMVIALEFFACRF